MRFLKTKVFSKMALRPHHHSESSEEEREPEVERVEQPTPIKPIEAEIIDNPLPKIIEPPKKPESSETIVDVKKSSISLTSESQSQAVMHDNTKNIVKNYGKAMCSFAASHLAVEYLQPLALQEKIRVDRFKEYYRCKKELLGSIESFRNLYIEDDSDQEEVKAFKRVFKQISIIFINYFSVNWIFNGKLTQKQAHLKYRYKMLRRIKNPELFTYLKA